MIAETLLNEETYVSVGVLLSLFGVFAAAWRLNKTILKLITAVNALRRDLRRVGKRVDRRLLRSEFIAFLESLRLMNPDLKLPEVARSLDPRNDMPDDDDDDDEEDGF